MCLRVTAALVRLLRAGTRNKYITCSNVTTYLSTSIGNAAKLPQAVSHHSTKAALQISKKIANSYLSVQSIFVNNVFKLHVVTRK